MRKSRLAAVPACLLLGACHAVTAGSSPQHLASGRYLGIGVYPAGELWQHLAIRRAAVTMPAATIADDEHVIVLVDSHTGEVRECGDYSAVCVGFAPWDRPLAMPEDAPLVLDKHAADLRTKVEAGGRRQEARPPA